METQLLENFCTDLPQIHRRGARRELHTHLPSHGRSCPALGLCSPSQRRAGDCWGHDHACCGCRCLRRCYGAPGGCSHMDVVVSRLCLVSEEMATGLIFLRMIHLESNGLSNPVLWENPGGLCAARNIIETFNFDTKLHPSPSALHFHCPSFSPAKHFSVQTQLTLKRSHFTCCSTRSRAHPPSSAGVGRVKACLPRRLRFT